jgi:hypothetical protein
LKLRDVSRRRRNTASFAASVKAKYSDSIVDKATTDCLCDPKEMHPFAKMNAYPEVDFASSGSVEKDASAKPVGRIVSVLEK